MQTESNKISYQKIRFSILLTICFIFFTGYLHATVHKTDTTHHNNYTDSTLHKHKKSGKFNPGTFIIEHITDSYEWHIATFGDFHLSIPLPIILISDYSGIHIFMSNKFHHGHSEHEGFRIAQEGKNKGKIVEERDGIVFERLPLDLSITKNVLAIFISLIFMVWIFLHVAKLYKKNEGKAPTGLQNALEPLILFIRDDVARPAIGEKKYERFFPFLLSIFFFILINNLMGLIPIFPAGANVTGNISVTLVLAMLTFIVTTINGNRNYWRHIFNAPGVPWWLKVPIPLMPIIEILGMFTKPFVLMVRLFANISAGHIIALSFFCLIFIFGNMNVYAAYGISVVSVLFTMFMTFLELLVAFIQAFVFTLLSAIYFGIATEEHH